MEKSEEFWVTSAECLTKLSAKYESPEGAQRRSAQRRSEGARRRSAQRRSEGALSAGAKERSAQSEGAFTEGALSQRAVLRGQPRMEPRPRLSGEVKFEGTKEPHSAWEEEK